MRRGKKPTRKQKIRLGQAGLAPENWLVVKQKANGELIILNKYHDTIRVIPSPSSRRAWIEIAAAMLKARCGRKPTLLATHDKEAIRELGWKVIELG